MRKYSVKIIYERIFEAESLLEVMKKLDNSEIIDELDRRSVEVVEVKQ